MNERTSARTPLRFGAGVVLYASFDSTWRWRYEVADLYHARYWNQIANYLMERPFSVKGEIVSLDAGGPTYRAGDVARIRVRLTDRLGKPLVEAAAEALLYRAGAKATTVPLAADPNRGGLFVGATGPLEPGDYEVGVVVEGFSELETKARTTFTVEPRTAREFVDLVLDEQLLRDMASAAGGIYAREEDAGAVVELLRPLSEGTVVVSETRLAQSYWWFLPLVALLTLEWLVRKRVGMV
jgi:hypothetical protein